MSYKLRFHELALKEWNKLDATLREQFKKKLAERLDNPCIASAALIGMAGCYKIKLRNVDQRGILTPPRPQSAPNFDPLS